MTQSGASSAGLRLKLSHTHTQICPVSRVSDCLYTESSTVFWSEGSCQFLIIVLHVLL